MLNIGNGSTWPGEIALRFYPQIFTFFTNQIKKSLILVAGTNGKTTTAKMIRHILIESNFEEKRIVHNDSGANLLNGLISAFIQRSSATGKIETDFAIFEVDEATVPVVLSYLPSFKKKLILIFLNLFRDQLDRYGEVDSIARKWKEALVNLSEETVVILNADDPQIAYLGKKLKAKTIYFGIDKPDKFLPEVEHATDSTYCLSCGAKLEYKGIYFSHLGLWSCSRCGNTRPKPQLKGWTSILPGLYNEYNTLAAVAVVKSLGVKDTAIREGLEDFVPAFGRQEEFERNGKKIKIFLSKNPAGFNASLRTVLEIKPKTLLLVLNDRIPDGRDVSWIWDVDFEMIPDKTKIVVSGDRVYDMALRIKYIMKQPARNPDLIGIADAGGFNNETIRQLVVKENLKEAIYAGLKEVGKGEILYILPTYSAMLDVRKILTGKKIL